MIDDDDDDDDNDDDNIDDNVDDNDDDELVLEELRSCYVGRCAASLSREAEASLKLSS